MADEIAVGYTVHNPHMTPSTTRAVVQGREMAVTVDSFEVELVADHVANGGIKLRFFGDDITAAQALFVNDARIVAYFAAWQG